MFKVYNMKSSWIEIIINDFLIKIGREFFFFFFWFSMQYMS